MRGVYNRADRSGHTSMPRIYYKGIQLDQIRSFCRVARLSSFAAAAAELGLSVPTVWRQVRALERECQVPLLARHGRQVRLTHEGRLAVELLEPYLSGIESVRDVLKDRLSTLPRRLTVASTTMLLAEYLTEPIRRYVEVEPSVLLSLLNETSDVALARVLDGTADVGIISYRPEEDCNPRATYEDLFELPWLLASVAGHPLSKKRSLRLADLTGWPWIMPAAETQPRRHIEEVLRRAGIRERIRVVMESRNFALTHSYVKMGLGISAWYGGAARQPGLWLRPVTQWFGVTPVAIALRAGTRQAPHIERFLDILRQSLHTEKR
jgi:DNA-binding transcriptional LysR family regulator